MLFSLLAVVVVANVDFAAVVVAVVVVVSVHVVAVAAVDAVVTAVSTHVARSSLGRLNLCSYDLQLSVD